MKIALDYDETYTADPELWDKFIASCEGKHEVWIVTMRRPTAPIDVNYPVIYTSRQAKMEFCLNIGHIFDIWIDDTPEWIFTNSR